MIFKVTVVVGLTVFTAVSAFPQAWSSTERPSALYSKTPQKHDERFRYLQGIVKDEHENPVEGALVNLKNLHTGKMLTFITRKDGKFRFDELSRDEDYEVFGQHNAEKTRVARMSRFDRKQDLMRILVLGTDEDNDHATAQTVSDKSKR